MDEGVSPGMISLGRALAWHAGRDPARPALTMRDQSYSREAFDRATNRLARAFAAHGIGKDDRVAVVLPTSPAHQISCFAIWKLGGLVMPLPHYAAEHELRHLIGLGDPKLVIGVDPARFPDHDVIPEGFEPDPALSDAPLPDAVATMWKASTSGGSTGLPKLIYEKRTGTIDPMAPMPMLRMTVDDVILHPAPAYHNAPFSQTSFALCWGAHVILMPRFDPVEWLRTVEKHRVRWAYLVPTMMSRILALPDDVRLGFDISSLEVVMHMAAPCPEWVKQAWIDWVGPDAVWDIYGGTEGFGGSVINGREWLAHRGSVGRPVSPVRIQDADGRPMATREIGGIFFRPMQQGGIIDLPDIWQSYGDMGWLDEDGYLYIADRRTDMILTGGANLYPAEIEGVIEQHPAIAGAVVVGLPDGDLGAKAHAVIELAPGANAPEPAELARFIGARLSRNKLPYTFEIVQGPLRNEAGKVRRAQIRAACESASSGSRMPLR